MEDDLHKLLEPFVNKPANLLVSGGSLLALFSTPAFDKLGKQKEWQIYFSDERLEGQTNIDDAKKYMSRFCDNYNDLRAMKMHVCDIAILSVGEDGHAASLFPDHPALDSNDDLLYITDSPKEPKKRVTVSIKYLNTAKKACVYDT